MTHSSTFGLRYRTLGRVRGINCSQVSPVDGHVGREPDFGKYIIVSCRETKL